MTEGLVIPVGTAEVRRRMGHFYTSVAAIFEAWVGRRQSTHAQRTSLQGVVAFVRFLGVCWPEAAWRL